MSENTQKLHMVCGKIAAGKSTLTAELGRQPDTIVLSEDAWLDALYGDQMRTIQDYVRCSARLRKTLGPHVAALLEAGVSVVLDFPANTVETRAWMRDILNRARVSHVLHVLDVSDEVCLARLRARNAAGMHPFAVSDEQFRQITKQYVPPHPDEGFTIVRHTGEADR